MVRMIAIFIFVWAAVMASVAGFRALTGREMWELTKLLTFSTVCAIIAFALLSAIVILF